MLLEIDRVYKIYENTAAVNGVSLNIPKQALFGLLGPNGAGKTTLIRMITGILLQDEGTIKLNEIPPKANRNLYIGYMPEERGLYKKMKVGEQLLYLAQLKDIPKQEAQKRLNHWLDKLNIQDWRNKQIAELSKGMQQKVQFIATVIHEPKLIILDEPFSGLDPINSRIIEREIFELRNAGATILFSTHRMEQVEEICESIALINRGNIILEGNVKDIKNQFKQHQYLLNAQQNINHETLRQAQSFRLIQSTDQSAVIQLIAPYTTANALNEALSMGIAINGFKEILPSLNDIFIEQVAYSNILNNDV